MDARLGELLNRLPDLPVPYRELRAEVERAIIEAERDPVTSLVYARRVLEHVLRDVFDRHVNGEKAGTRPLENVLQRVVKDGHFPGELAGSATAIKDLANRVVHDLGKSVPVSYVVPVLSQLVLILRWYCESECMREGRVASCPPGGNSPPGRTAELPLVVPAVVDSSEIGRDSKSIYVKFGYQTRGVSCVLVLAMPVLLLLISSTIILDSMFSRNRVIKEQTDLRRPEAKVPELPDERSALLSGIGEASSINGTYTKKRRGRLRFILSFSEASREARLKLAVHGPEEETYERDGSSDFTLEIDAAAPGDWRWTVTALAIPFKDFPFTLTVKE